MDLRKETYHYFQMSNNKDSIIDLQDIKIMNKISSYIYHSFEKPRKLIIYILNISKSYFTTCGVLWSVSKYNNVVVK